MGNKQSAIASMPSEHVPENIESPYQSSQVLGAPSCFVDDLGKFMILEDENVHIRDFVSDGEGYHIIVGSKGLFTTNPDRKEFFEQKNLQGDSSSSF